MKIVTFLLGLLLVAALGGAAFFYTTTFQPMSLEYERLKAGMPELDKAKTELKKYKDEETRETAWIGPAVTALSKDLANELKDGKAEVTAAGKNAVVINISESALYTPESKTFAKDTQTRSKLVALLKRDELKGKDILIGNATEAIPAHGKGRKRVPAKDALELASERSEELVKYLVKNGVPQETIAALAYSTKLPERGFKIKNGKTMIIIGVYPPPATLKQEKAPAEKPKPAAVSKPTATTAPSPKAQPKTIPFKKAQPKTK